MIPKMHTIKTNSKMLKTCSKLGIEMNFLKLMKGSYQI